jgi:hypothetical protein
MTPLVSGETTTRKIIQALEARAPEYKYGLGVRGLDFLPNRPSFQGFPRGAYRLGGLSSTYIMATASVIIFLYGCILPKITLGRIGPVVELSEL